MRNPNLFLALHFLKSRDVCKFSGFYAFTAVVDRLVIFFRVYTPCGKHIFIRTTSICRVAIWNSWLLKKLRKVKVRYMGKMEET